MFVCISVVMQDFNIEWQSQQQCLCLHFCPAGNIRQTVGQIYTTDCCDKLLAINKHMTLMGNPMCRVLRKVNGGVYVIHYD